MGWCQDLALRPDPDSFPLPGQPYLGLSVLAGADSSSHIGEAGSVPKVKKSTNFKLRPSHFLTGAGYGTGGQSAYSGPGQDWAVIHLMLMPIKVSDLIIEWHMWLLGKNLSLVLVNMCCFFSNLGDFCLPWAITFWPWLSCNLIHYSLLQFWHPSYFTETSSLLLNIKKDLLWDGYPA